MTVSELNSEVKISIERAFPNVWVEGEVVGFKQVGKGHWYFNLHDGDASVKCVCWAGTNWKIRFKPEDGVTIRIRGRLDFWAAKGELKLNVDSLEPSGEGALRAAFEQMKERLEREGLFAQELKRPIPFFPRRVGVITSRSGAAFHDIVTVLTRRARSVRVVFAAAQVQGEGAAGTIRRAILALNEYSRRLAEHERIDVLIVGRGGGSAEDLAAFNDEALARAIRMSEIPVISAVGHEIDWTIADLIADLRAATPSAAAELVAAREEDIVEKFCVGEERLTALMGRQLNDLALRLDSAHSAMEYEMEHKIRSLRDGYLATASRISPERLQMKSRQLVSKVDVLANRVIGSMQNQRDQSAERLHIQMAKLNTLSPLAVLTRGYSIAQTEDGSIVRAPEQVKTGDKLKIQLERGKLDAAVLRAE